MADSEDEELCLGLLPATGEDGRDEVDEVDDDEEDEELLCTADEVVCAALNGNVRPD